MKKIRNPPMNFDVENWLWKSNFGTFWHSLILYPHLKTWQPRLPYFTLSNYFENTIRNQNFQPFSLHTIKTCHQYLKKWRLKKDFAHSKMYIVYISYIRYRVVFSDKHGMLFFLLLGCLYILQLGQNWYKIAFQILLFFS